VDRALLKVDLDPSPSDDFRHASRMTVSEKGKCRVPVSVATGSFCRGDHAVDFSRRKLFPRTTLAVPYPLGGQLSHFRWLGELDNVARIPCHSKVEVPVQPFMGKFKTSIAET
jgi:hypothetical protein